MKTTKAQRKLINDAQIAGCTVEIGSTYTDISKVDKQGFVGIRINEDGTAHRTDVSADSALTIRTQKVMREILGLTSEPKQITTQESTQESTQLTDSEIQEMLGRNGLQLSFNAETSKYELRQMRGGKTIDMKSCQFKTPLIATARLFDLQRSKRTT